VWSGRGLCDGLTECGVSKKCNSEASKKMRRPRPPWGCRAIGKKKTPYILLLFYQNVESGDSRSLQNAGIFFTKYTSSHPTRQ
jgi:hypothetical protein